MSFPEVERAAEEIMAMISQAWLVGSPPPAVRAFVATVIARAMEDREHAVLERLLPKCQECYLEAGKRG